MGVGEASLRRAVAASGAGIWEWDARSDLTAWSATLKRMFGLPADAAVTRQTLHDMVHPQDRAEVQRRLREALEGGGEYSAQYRIRRGDGSERWIESRGRAEYGPQGQPLRMLGTARDITEAKCAELSRQATEQRFRALVEALTQVVWFADARGNVVRLSDSLLRLTGVDPEQATGARWLNLLHPDDVEQTVALWARCVATGEVYATEFRVRLADGGYRHFAVQAVPLEGAQGGEREWIGICTDIDDRKRSAEALRQANEALARQVAESERAESAARRLNRVHAVMSGISSLIVRTRCQSELLEGACRIAVEQGKFRLAWIGSVAGSRIKPVARFGADDGYIEDNVCVDLGGGDPAGAGPVADAVRDNRMHVCNDIACDPDLAPWREAALRHGFRSRVVFPLVVRGKVAGSMTLYAGEPGFFDSDELKLIAQLAGDISYAMEFIQHQEEIDQLAYYDPLTGLANRRLFTDRLKQFMETAAETGPGLAVLVLDLAHFKSVNYALGVSGGDDLLKRAARRLQRFAGGAHQLARLGGDRFAAVIPGVKQAADLAAVLGERVWDSLNRPYKLHGQELCVSARLGIALFPDDAGDADSLIQHAEAALKKAKASGDRYLFYTQEMGAVLHDKLRLEGELRHALERSEFVLHYQPRVDLHSGAICGVEALLRWNHPESGLVAPARFIPLLEETGMILEAGRWVLSQAAADRRRWLAEGLPALRVAVNVSPHQLQQHDFARQLRSLVGAAGGDCGGIEIEVTESVLMRDMDKTIDTLRAVQAMGVTVAIDDFGTGYSSLAYLSKLPINVLKIDRSFIVAMASSATTMGIVSTIVSLARSMNLRVTAEGVDSPDQIKLLRLLRCHEMQGFIFSPPVPAEALAAMLRSGRRLSSADFDGAGDSLPR